MKLAEKLLNEVKEVKRKEVAVLTQKNGKLKIEYRTFKDDGTFTTSRRFKFDKHDEIKEYIDLYNNLANKSIGLKQSIENRKKFKNFPDNDFYKSIRNGTFRQELK